MGHDHRDAPQHDSCDGEVIHYEPSAQAEVERHLLKSRTTRPSSARAEGSLSRSYAITPTCAGNTSPSVTSLFLCPAAIST